MMGSAEEQPVLKISHQMSMDSEWRADFVDQLGARIINSRQMRLPDDMAEGCSYFMEVMPGLMVLIVDFTFHTSIEFTKLASKGEFCIVYFDLSDNISLHQVNGTRHQVGYQSKLGLGIVDAALRSTYIPAVGERMYSFRLLVSKSLLKTYFQGNMSALMVDRTFDGRKNTMFLYSHIKSSTWLALNQLKDTSYDSPSFELMLKGVTFKVFGHLIEQMKETGPVIVRQITEVDAAQVMKTQAYLMEQLQENFPGVDLLAEMAGMSVSKYSDIFKKLFKFSPKQFFLREKMLLAQVLLGSGDFGNISEVAYEVGFGKPGYFSKLYKNMFNEFPSTAFRSRE
ncbi:helix-turn-helix domain-containing protein [Pedobacter antarcticus]|uniref:helix-turn-helix domain-containing protein n=1 Tax=Pedobacter antarcticus TaxID=34086 RepID=UPI00088F5F18|nr:AraC family transcriptional regulator [Pedobacter antarcticus]SDM59458.1 AraC-type DNA-binding protein [Pedobacter antarcticus]